MIALILMSFWAFFLRGGVESWVLFYFKNCRLPPLVILGKLGILPSFSGVRESFDAGSNGAYRQANV